MQDKNIDCIIDDRLEFDLMALSVVAKSLFPILLSTNDQPSSVILLLISQTSELSKKKTPQDRNSCCFQAFVLLAYTHTNFLNSG